MSFNLKHLVTAALEDEGGAVSINQAQGDEFLRCIRNVTCRLPLLHFLAFAVRMATPPKPRRTRATKGGAR